MCLLFFGGFTTGKSLDVNEFKAYAKSVDEISTPQEYNIIALGEVTHGNKEFQQLKLEVFKKTCRRASCSHVLL